MTLFKLSITFKRNFLLFFFSFFLAVKIFRPVFKNVSDLNHGEEWNDEILRETAIGF